MLSGPALNISQCAIFCGTLNLDGKTQKSPGMSFVLPLCWIVRWI
jgi:hypothetical protein